jgi:dTDP-4-amino-4,6-dideoxygalactose transaminase
MRVPLVDLRSQYLSLKDEIDGAIARVIDNCTFILGDEVRMFEEEFASFCGVKFAVGVASGTAALHLALRACGVETGDEVITSPFTFIATAEAISHAGARPVFADIDPLTYNIDPKKIEDAISEKTRAIIPVHLYGHPAEMDELRTIASRYNLKIIEDAAQAHGARYKGKSAGALGDIGCFSFYPGKNLGAYGDGGAVTTNDEQLAQSVRMLRNHGRQDKFIHQVEGYGERLDALQAAILSVKLKYIEKWIERRQWVARQYTEQLSGLDDISLVYQSSDVFHAFHLFVIRASKRQQLKQWLEQREISTGIHYPIPLHLQPAYKWMGHHISDFPHSEHAAQEVLSLPMYPELEVSQIEFIGEEIRAFFRES